MDAAKDTAVEKTEEAKATATDVGETAKDKAAGAEAATEEKAAEVKSDKPAKPKFSEKISSTFQQTGAKFSSFFSGVKDKASPKK